jgi:hypothetical protein
MWLQHLSGSATLSISSDIIESFIGQPLTPFQIAAKHAYEAEVKRIKDDALHQNAMLIEARESKFQAIREEYSQYFRDVELKASEEFAKAKAMLDEALGLKK